MASETQHAKHQTKTTMATAKKGKKAKTDIPLIPVSELQLRGLGATIMGRDPEGRSMAVFEDRWMSFFGVSVSVAVIVWNLLQVPVHDDGDFSHAKPEHLLWALLFLKKYGDEREMAVLAGGVDGPVDEKTFRKWAHIFVRHIAGLIFDVIVWENRLMGDIGNDCLVSVDGTDCMIPFQQAAPEAFYTHKHNCSGLRYEIGICILTGFIVWVMGPFPCGDWPDIEIFRYALKHLLGENERVEADDGYVGEDPANIKVPGSMVHRHDDKQMYVRSKVHRRHETVNKCIKQFKCLHTVFRQDISFHGDCFRACTVLTQLVFEQGNPMFDSKEYKDP